MQLGGSFIYCIDVMWIGILFCISIQIEQNLFGVEGDGNFWCGVDFVVLEIIIWKLDGDVLVEYLLGVLMQFIVVVVVC